MRSKRTEQSILQGVSRCQGPTPALKWLSKDLFSTRSHPNSDGTSFSRVLVYCGNTLPYMYSSWLYTLGQHRVMRSQSTPLGPAPPFTSILFVLFAIRISSYHRGRVSFIGDLCRVEVVGRKSQEGVQKWFPNSRKRQTPNHH